MTLKIDKTKKGRKSSYGPNWHMPKEKCVCTLLSEYTLEIQSIFLEKMTKTIILAV